jgi:hypothetical protein
LGVLEQLTCIIFKPNKEAETIINEGLHNEQASSYTGVLISP